MLELLNLFWGQLFHHHAENSLFQERLAFISSQISDDVLGVVVMVSLIMIAMFHVGGDPCMIANFVS